MSRLRHMARGACFLISACLGQTVGKGQTEKPPRLLGSPAPPPASLPPPASPPRANLVLLLTDDQGPVDTSLRVYHDVDGLPQHLIRTPNMRRLAAGGMVLCGMVLLCDD